MVFLLRSFVRGPLEPFVSGFADELAWLGYTRCSLEQHVCFIAHLDRWLATERLGVGDLSAATVDRYLRERRAAGYVNYRTMKAMRPLLSYLDQLGMVPAAEVAAGQAGHVVGGHPNRDPVDRDRTGHDGRRSHVSAPTSDHRRVQEGADSRRGPPAPDRAPDPEGHMSQSPFSEAINQLKPKDQGPRAPISPRP